MPADVAVRQAVYTSGTQRFNNQVLGVAMRTGQDLIEINETPNCRPSHEVINGKVFSISGMDCRFPKWTSDLEALTHDYNCGHEIAIYHEELGSVFTDPLEGTGYTIEEARKAFAKQRRYEKEIRKQKRVVEALKAGGMDTTEANAKLNATRHRLKKHIDENSAILRRERHREQLYDSAQRMKNAAKTLPKTPAVEETAEIIKLRRLLTALEEETLKHEVGSKSYELHIKAIAETKDLLEEKLKELGKSGGTASVASKAGSAKPVKAVKKSEHKAKASEVANSESDRYEHAYTDLRKNSAKDFKSAKSADAYLRAKSGEVWQEVDFDTKKAIHDYTTNSYKQYNRPLSGFDVNLDKHTNGWGKSNFVGRHKVDLDNEGKGDAIKALTDAISKSSYPDDMWLYRGCDDGAIESLLGIDYGTLRHIKRDDLSQFVNKTGKIDSFVSCGSAQGKGLLSSAQCELRIYVPEGSEALYVEPVSDLGKGAGLKWDGKKGQSSFGREQETIIQRGGTYKVTKIERDRSGKYHIELEHRPEYGYDKFGQDEKGNK